MLVDPTDTDEIGSALGEVLADGWLSADLIALVHAGINDRLSAKSWTGNDVVPIGNKCAVDSFDEVDTCAKIIPYERTLRHDDGGFN